MVWKEPEESAPKKAKVTISAGKVMAMENFKWEIFTHLPHSPELAPSDFHLYPALKWHLGGKHFANDDEVQAEANHWLLRQDTACNNFPMKGHLFLKDTLALQLDVVLYREVLLFANPEDSKNRLEIEHEVIVSLD
ncbi:hypothetical protein LAZ67_10003964 [Cordylochernes scorpioides]|uniref:MATH domain-containing protein n=1 Tax=Cordylochernes scorpioides TaxID=51811 RepID=A0ABY6KXB2_9ARAC|nr:hypothetical protein LAZ67_10003964 [Cordylochernes scorpioides]